MAGRESVSKNTPIPRTPRNKKALPVSAIKAKEQTAKASPGAITNGILGRLAIQPPRYNTKSCPPPEKTSRSANCQLAGAMRFTAITGTLARMPMVIAVRMTQVR
jgi:hypothetical protein